MYCKKKKVGRILTRTVDAYRKKKRNILSLVYYVPMCLSCPAVSTICTHQLTCFIYSFIYLYFVSSSVTSHPSITMPKAAHPCINIPTSIFPLTPFVSPLGLTSLALSRYSKKANCFTNRMMHRFTIFAM